MSNLPSRVGHQSYPRRRGQQQRGGEVDGRAGDTDDAGGQRGHVRAEGGAGGEAARAVRELAGGQRHLAPRRRSVEVAAGSLRDHITSYFFFFIQ